MTSATPPSLQAARWAADIATAFGVDEITTTGGSGPEIVTATSPRMMTRPVTEPASAASASCQTTDDTAAARVGDMVTVEHRGICDRVATGMVTKRDLDDRYSGDQVATINGQSVTVGGSTTIDALTTAGGLVASRASGSSGELETRTSSGTQRTYMRPSGVSGTSGWFVGAGVEGRLELSSPLAPAIYGLSATSSSSAQTLKLKTSSGGLPLIYLNRHSAVSRSGSLTPHSTPTASSACACGSGQTAANSPVTATPATATADPATDGTPTAARRG